MTTLQHSAPARFGKYLLMDRLAAGGMAELFLAKQIGLKGFEKVVAIKRILPALTQDQEFVGMFINEAKLAALLSHQHIVQIFDLGTTEGFYYIAMEYVMGKDLRALVQRSQARSLPLTPGHALLIASRICAGLDYAHRKKDLHGRDLHLVHRDVSPQNILISYEGEIKLVDFGIAKATTQATETRTGTLKGKLSYMSPEQATGKPLDHRSDIFSLGIVLHELVTGQRMFTGNNEFAIIEQVRQAQIAPPSTFNRDLPPEIDGLIMRALAKNPDERFQQASDMELAIDHLIAAKGYAFSSLSLANYMHALFEQDLSDDTVRVQRIAAVPAGSPMEGMADWPTAVPSSQEGTPSRKSTSGRYAPLAPKNMPQPSRLPVTKAFFAAIALLGWAALLLAMWQPSLVPVRQWNELKLALNRQVDQMIAQHSVPTAQDAPPAVPSQPLGSPSAVAPPVATPPAPQAAFPSASTTAGTSTVPPRPVAAPEPELTDPTWSPAGNPPDIGAARRPPGFPLRQEQLQLYEEARRAYQSGDLAVAERSLRDALSVNPQAVHGYHLLAMVLREEKKTDPAIAILTEGINRFPGTAILHHDLGRLYADKNIASLAIDELQLAVAMDPSAPWTKEDEQLLSTIRAAPPAPSSDPAETAPDTAPPKE
ncbi:MAG TPA: protein kinase [Nitrospiria bacterium]|nr:protein kinase [Nitrospiria bacterium]